MSETKNKIYRTLLFDQEGCCYLCCIEEWRTMRRFQLHRVIKGRDGGTYTKQNCVLVCNKCHARCEGLTAEQIRGLRVAHEPNSMVGLA